MSEENTNISNISTETETKKKETEIKKSVELLQEELKARREKNRIAQEAMGEGKGRLRLETPIEAGDDEVEELAYDFTQITGMEYIEAMDSDPGAMQIFRMTYRQGLALFAVAAAKQTPVLDAKDILERIGITDAVEGVQLAILFFNASTRAGRLRISKM